MPRNVKGKTKKGAKRSSNTVQLLKSIKSDMVRMDDLSRIYDDLEEIKRLVSKRRKRRFSLSSRPVENDEEDSNKSFLSKPPSVGLDIQKATQLAQNPMVQKMIKNMLNK